ncbi:MAG: YdcF family protein [Candidatus Thiodiazotropha sp. (ex Notomyrtea botanica)]|nr:YdcF family protein [Candidatus Thiodiazotropha sp. (ex Notomyrtea botanica)]
MQFDPEQGKVDWDGLFTFFITLLFMTVTLGIPLLISLRYVYHFAKKSRSDTSEKQLLVFGKRLKQGQIDGDYRQRLTKASQLMQASRERRLILLGGAINKSKISEAAAGQAWLETSGIETSRMMREEKSQNTLENLKHAKQLMQGLSSGPVAMISNRYHLARIHTIASSLGIEHQLCACEEQLGISLKTFPRLMMEAWYILWFTTGKKWARIIGSQRMINRVT